MITGPWLKIISCLPKQSKLRGTNDVTLFKKKKKKAIEMFPKERKLLLSQTYKWGDENREAG